MDGEHDADSEKLRTEEAYCDVYFKVKKPETAKPKFSYTSDKTGQMYQLHLDQETVLAAPPVVGRRRGTSATAPVVAQFTPVDLTGKRVVSVNPGSRDLITCLSHKENGGQVTWSFSYNEWKNRMGAR